MTPEQLQQFNDLQEKVTQLENMLSIVGMPYELKEIIRNEVIKQEDSTQTLTEVYPVSMSNEVTATKSYAGALVFKWKGKEYTIPYL